MPYTVLVHVTGEEAVLGEVEELPSAEDNIITVNNPRRRDEKDLPYLHETVTTVVWPLWRVNFIEVMPTREDEDLIGFVRE
jgi:hypothetical protein